MLSTLGILLVVVTLFALYCNTGNCNFAYVPSKDKWPPISDDEFMRRCSPGVNRDRALKVRRIISEQLGVEYDRIYPEQRFVDDLGCD
jgi:hypothetical protein